VDNIPLPSQNKRGGAEVNPQEICVSIWVTTATRGSLYSAQLKQDNTTHSSINTTLLTDRPYSSMWKELANREEKRKYCILIAQITKHAY